MGYTDKIICPHCHKPIELDIDIDWGGGMDDIYAIFNAIKKGGDNNEVNMEGKHKLRDGSHTSQALHGNRRQAS